MTKTYDGQPIQAGVRETQLTGRYPQWAIAGVREGVVVDRYYVKDGGNLSQAHIEYDVRDLHQPLMYLRCRRLEKTYGSENGEENTLKPASKAVGSLPFHKFRKARDIDGDRVMLCFINGSSGLPIIVGSLPHPSSGEAYAGERDVGERRFAIHQGTSFETDNDGNHVITPAEDATIKFGTKEAAENFVLGQQWKAMMESLIDAINAITVPTAWGPSGTPINAAQFTAIKAALDDQLSKIIFGEEG